MAGVFGLSCAVSNALLISSSEKRWAAHFSERPGPCS